MVDALPGHLDLGTRTEGLSCVRVPIELREVAARAVGVGVPQQLFPPRLGTGLTPSRIGTGTLFSILMLLRGGTSAGNFHSLPWAWLPPASSIESAALVKKPLPFMASGEQG